LPQLPIFVIDGDTVEEKNLMRQNFIQKDVGQNKAVVVSNRYSNAFGIPIYPSSDFLKEDVAPTFPSKPSDVKFSFNNSIVILAVDSADARREILQVISSNRTYGLTSVSSDVRNTFVIDAGNEDAFGQVKFFTNSKISIYSDIDLMNFRKRFPKNLPEITQTDFIPIDMNYYSNLGSSAAELSCVDLPQTLAINNMMSALICSVLQNFLFIKPMTYDCIRFSLDGAMYTEYNTPRKWLLRAKNEIPHKNINQVLAAYRNIRVDNSSGIFYTALNSALRTYKNNGLRVDENGDLEPIPVKKSIVPPTETLETKAQTPTSIPEEFTELGGVETPINMDIPPLVRVTGPAPVAEVPPLRTGVNGTTPTPRRRRQPAIPPVAPVTPSTIPQEQPIEIELRF
jgi:molybdopterin/thiamine biosynthesis adenylyltransferase